MAIRSLEIIVGFSGMKVGGGKNEGVRDEPVVRTYSRIVCANAPANLYAG
jgi:hypothetical protein